MHFQDVVLVKMQNKLHISALKNSDLNVFVHNDRILQNFSINSRQHMLC